jgi:cytochrome c553
MKSGRVFPLLLSALLVTVGGGYWLLDSVGTSIADTRTTRPDPTIAQRYVEKPNPLGDQGVADLVGAGSNDEWACSSCHGEGGEGSLNVPRLAGLPAGYLIKQLNDYQSGARYNDNMQFVVKGLSSDELIALGHYYAGLETPPSAKPAFNGDLDRGRQLALEGDWSIDAPACFSCHGSSGWGVGEIFPGLAGQHPVYTFTQLNDWHNGDRSNSPIGLMKSVAGQLSRQDMQSVSDYLAGLVPPQPRNEGNAANPVDGSADQAHQSGDNDE